MKYWWVNQKQSYAQERDGGILWAPLRGRDGSRRYYWDTLVDVAPGDVIYHYANGRLKARSVAMTTARDALRPGDLPAGLWNGDGRLVRTLYVEASSPVLLDEIPKSLRLGEPKDGPFQVDAAVKVGYLFPLSTGFGSWLDGTFAPRFAAGALPVLPPEARHGATNLLRRLIGEDLSTPSGNINRILGVTPPNVIVATDRSPAGQPVPIADIDSALELLHRDGSVMVDPSTLGHRSAFVGAVLMTLPGVSLTTDPQVLHLAASTGDVTNDTVTFEGDTDRPRTVLERREQGKLRSLLLGKAEVAQCALCGKTYPARFLWAAHIKKRSLCTEDERADLGHIAMLACVFGCDVLYETGYLTVSSTGEVLVSSLLTLHPALQSLAEPLAGRICTAHTPGSAAYFAWHRANKFLQ